MSVSRDESEIRETTVDVYEHCGIDRTESNKLDMNVYENRTIDRKKSDLNNNSNSNADEDVLAANNLKEEMERGIEGGTDLDSTVDGVNNVDSENDSVEHSHDQHVIAGEEPTNVIKENDLANIQVKASESHGISAPYRDIIAGMYRF